MVSLVALVGVLFLATSSLLPLLAGLLAFLALWIFACVIPFDVFYANRTIGVSAALLGKAIDANTIGQAVSALGVSLRYRDYNFRECCGLCVRILSLIRSSSLVGHLALVRLPVRGAVGRTGASGASQGPLRRPQAGSARKGRRSMKLAWSHWCSSAALR